MYNSQTPDRFKDVKRNSSKAEKYRIRCNAKIYRDETSSRETRAQSLVFTKIR